MKKKDHALLNGGGVYLADVSLVIGLLLIGTITAHAAPAEISFIATGTLNHADVANLLCTQFFEDAGQPVFQLQNFSSDVVVSSIFFAFTEEGSNPINEGAAPVLAGTGSVSFAGTSLWNLPGIDEVVFYSAENTIGSNTAISVNESLFVRFQYAAGKSADDVLDALSTKDLVIGMFVQSSGSLTGPGDWYISNEIKFQSTVGDPIPEPATVALLGLGIVGLVIRRGKSMLRG